MTKQELMDALRETARQYLDMDRETLLAAAKQAYENAVRVLRENGVRPETGVQLIAASLSGDGKLTAKEERLMRDLMGKAPAETLLESLAFLTADAYKAAGQLKTLSDTDKKTVLSLTACFLAADGDVNRDELETMIEFLL